MMRRRWYTLVLATALILGGSAITAGEAQARTHRHFGQTSTLHGATLDGQQMNGQTSPAGGNKGANGGPSQTSATGSTTGPASWKVTRYVVACDPNTPDGGGGIRCGAAVYTCGAQGKGYIRMWVYVRTLYADGRKPTDWERVGSVCRGPDQPTIVKPQVTRQMVIDAATALAPHGAFVMEPATRSIVNAPNNFAATDTAAVTRDPVVLGITIPVAFTPVGYTWDFGDGSTGTGAGIVHAAVHQPGAVEHAYLERGTYPVTLTPVYKVRFTLPGGGPIVAQVNGFPSAAQDLNVEDAEAVVTG